MTSFHEETGWGFVGGVRRRFAAPDAERREIDETLEATLKTIQRMQRAQVRWW